MFYYKQNLSILNTFKMSYKNIKRALKFQTNERLSGSSIDKIFKFLCYKFINIV